MFIEKAQDEEGEDVFYVAEAPGVWVAGPYLKREKAQEKLDTHENP